ncbi:uncharacterized TPR repeat-containing protein At2g32450-like [Macadamia integrifolia]|uniref:uncharacterized TPR repeat-containing protein At2g32450-like n=1 Tax=Macadamia integrifolia TaxID=60698 RepID=UPI001C4FE13F|nr:uncharacterized TPR repeat-containing protein At2g32450-like [Macadamia integrifolia]
MSILGLFHCLTSTVKSHSSLLSPQTDFVAPETETNSKSLMASSQRSMSTTTMMSRRYKVRSIFDRFDANGDGGLNRDEMGALVTAVNPKVKFSSDQISAILDKVFRSYSFLIENPLTGLSFKGLLRIYEDGAGFVGHIDRDYSALFPSSEVISKIPNFRVSAAWAKSPNHGFKVEFDNTWKLVEDLEIIIRRKIKSFTHGCSDISVDFDKKFLWDENCADYRKILKEVREIRVAIDRNLQREEAFDGHMAIGRTLQYYNLLIEALQSFQRAADLSPIDVRPHFMLGNCLYHLGRLNEAKVCYLLVLELGAETNSNKWVGLLPDLHVNLGIVLEGEGMLLSACEHYREAAILCPTHYGVLGLLGGVLLRTGEYGEAEKVLEKAVFLNPEYTDAYCDLGLVLRAMGEDERAILEFQRAIDLNPIHLDALYNLGCLFEDMGRYHRAAELYGRVVGIQPNYWQAQMNRAVLLWRTGKGADAGKVLRVVRKKMTNKDEIYDASIQIRMQMNKKKKKKNQGKATSKFTRASEKTTRRDCLDDAFHIWDFQWITTLHLCDVSLLNKEEIGTGSEEWETDQKSLISKAALELILRKLLHFLKPDDFRGTIKAVNEQILSVLDATNSGRVDLGMFYAVIAPICAGEPRNRKRAAFDALLWRRSRRKEAQAECVIGKIDALIYIRYLRLIYLNFPSQGYSTDPLVAHEEKDDEKTMISFPEFLQIFDDNRQGFGILSTLVKLETNGRISYGEHSCDFSLQPLFEVVKRKLKIFGDH